MMLIDNDRDVMKMYGTPTADSFFIRDLEYLSEDAFVCGNDNEHEYLGKRYPWEERKV